MSDTFFLSSAHIIRIHDEAIREGGGLQGLRDHNALESVSVAPQTFLAYQPETDIWTLSAILFERLVHSHVFSDANKRTAFMTAGTFLRMNGKRFHCEKSAALKLVVKVATHEISQTEIANFLMTHSHRKV